MVRLQKRLQAGGAHGCHRTKGCARDMVVSQNDLQLLAEVDACFCGCTFHCLKVEKCYLYLN